MELKGVIGLLNTILKGIRIVTGEPASLQSAELIAKGILNSITKKSIAEDFKYYVKEIYSINLN